MVFTFWLSLFIVFYTFFGYGIVLYILVTLRALIKGNRPIPDNKGNWPTVSLIISAYNEEDCIADKIKDTLALTYPANKLEIIFVTDGSSDRTPEIVAQYPQIKLMHEAARKGKLAAIHRVMGYVKSEIVVLTDANTFLNHDALLLLCRHYADPKIGAVSGEKRVKVDDVADATAGEGFYWKYESKLKTWDAELYSIVGAAGELISYRTALYEPIPADTILDDFMISMLIAEAGYRVVYEPLACATETGSDNVKEELKRKIRIAAGGIQCIVRLKKVLNPFRNFTLTFQYISHRVLRWTVTPFLMILAFVLNAIIAFQTHELLYEALFAAQVFFYTLSLLGWIMERQQIKVKIFFIPYYFCMMNYAVAAGIKRYISKSQSAVWEKSKRR